MQVQGQSAGQVVEMQRRLYRYQAECTRLAAQAAEEDAAHVAEVARLRPESRSAPQSVGQSGHA